MKLWPLVVGAVLFVAGVQAWSAAALLRDRAEETSLATQLAAERARSHALATEADRADAQLQAARAEAGALSGALAGNQSRAASLSTDLAALGRERDAALAQVNATEAELADAKGGIFDRQQLLGELQAQRADYAALDARYQSALDGAFPTLASIQAGNVTWRFVDAEGVAHAWRYPLEDYQAYAQRARPDAVVAMRTADGTILTAADPRPYVTPSFFASDIGDLTRGKTDREFVRDAFAVKGQLVVYGFALADQEGHAYKYPAETLTEGSGLCGDTTILLASLLLAGEAQAHYGLRLKVWIVDVDPERAVTIADPETVNHALLEVDFRDGETWDLETTTAGLYRYPEVHGWSFDVEPPAGA